VVAVLVILALVDSMLFGILLGAWGAFVFVRMLKPGREGDLLAELAALRASQGLHHAALETEGAWWRATNSQTGSPT
jgi:hypothetical protein